MENVEEKTVEEAKQTLDFLDEIDILVDEKKTLKLKTSDGEYFVSYGGLTIDGLQAIFAQSKKAIRSIINEARNSRKQGTPLSGVTRSAMSVLFESLVDLVAGIPEALLMSVCKSIQVEQDHEDGYETIEDFLRSLSTPTVIALFGKIFKATDVDLITKVFIGLVSDLEGLIDLILPKEEEPEETDQPQTPPEALTS